MSKSNIINRQCQVNYCFVVDTGEVVVSFAWVVLCYFRIIHIVFCYTLV